MSMVEPMKWPIMPELILVSLAWSDLEYFYSPLDGMLVHRKVIPGIILTGTHLCTWVKRGTMRVNCLAQEHNLMPQPGFEPGMLDPESSLLTIRQSHFPHIREREGVLKEVATITCNRGILLCNYWYKTWLNIICDNLKISLRMVKAIKKHTSCCEV